MSLQMAYRRVLHIIHVWVIRGMPWESAVWTGRVQCRVAGNARTGQPTQITSPPATNPFPLSSEYGTYKTVKARLRGAFWE